MSPRPLPPLVRDRLTGEAAGVVSVCTAHPIVIEAALLRGKQANRRVLIEATCNQVNQDGGYTGMTPAAFRRFVEEIAARVAFDPGALILGGDHLGPNPWKHLPADAAMARARTMIEAYAKAGFTKLHLDTSMGCAGEPAGLTDAITARRAAALAMTAEAALDREALLPVYIVGTEVPTPGGATDAMDHLEITRSDAALRTVEIHRKAFADLGLERAFGRVIGVVVQPGVEFGNTDVAVYRHASATDLIAVLDDLPNVTFEAHSTDYQPPSALHNLVEDGFAILKVGPWLTFALREALYGLDAIAQVLAPVPPAETLVETMERLMVEAPDHWRQHTSGDPGALRMQRHFGYSDRIRYYWPLPAAQEAVSRLLDRLGERILPNPLISQFLGGLYPAVADGSVAGRPRDLLIGSVQRVLDVYDGACGTDSSVG